MAVCVASSDDVNSCKCLISASTVVVSWSTYLATFASSDQVVTTLLPAFLASVTFFVIAVMSSVTFCWAFLISANVLESSAAAVCNAALSSFNVAPAASAWSVMFVGTSAVAIPFASVTASSRFFCNGFKIPSTISCCALMSEAFVVPSFLGSVKFFKLATAVANLSWSAGDNFLIWSSKFAGSATVALPLAVANASLAPDTALSKSPSALFNVSVFKSVAFKASFTACLAVLTASESETFVATIVSTAVWTFLIASSIFVWVPSAIACFKPSTVNLTSSSRLTFGWALSISLFPSSTAAWRFCSTIAISSANFWRASVMAFCVAAVLSAAVKSFNAAMSSSMAFVSWSVYLATFLGSVQVATSCLPAVFASVTFLVMSAMSSSTFCCAFWMSSNVDLSSAVTFCKLSLSACNVDLSAWSAMLIGTVAFTVVLAVSIAFWRFSCKGFKIPSTISCCTLMSETFVVSLLVGSVKFFKLATAVANLAWSSFGNLPIWSSKLAGSSTVACFLAASSLLSACLTASS